MASELESEIKRMILEMNSGHNDGWVTNHYREELKRLKKLIDGALEGDKNGKRSKNIRSGT